MRLPYSLPATTRKILGISKIPKLPLMEMFSNGKRKDKVVVIMGPTGSGKSKLSIDLATRFPGEVINSDKIQVYKGLNITTNKISYDDQLGVPHHLLGDFDSLSPHSEFTPSLFRTRGSHLIDTITKRGNIPYIVGGSNSFIYALLSEHYDPNSDVFAGFNSVSTELRYDCCFLYVDVSLPILNEYLKKRVDEMIDSGMVDELAEYYNSGKVHEWARNTGLRKAIGVPEFEKYFNDTWRAEEGEDRVREGVYKEAVKAVKENTCKLAKVQVEKIQRLRRAGWEVKRLDGTDAIREVLEGSKSWVQIWERQVVEPSVMIVKRFLQVE